MNAHSVQLRSVRQKTISLMVAVLTGSERHFWIHPNLLMVCTRMTIWAQETHSKLFLTTVHGKTPVDAARNIAVHEMHKANAEWLLQIDNDVVPPMNILSILQGIGDRKIVGLPCPIEYETGKFSTNIATYHRDDLHELHLQIAPGWSQVDDAGSGCLLIHRDVFDALSEPWFECTRSSGRTAQEDFGFCDKARAKGISVWTHGDFACRHFKTVDLGEPLRIQTQKLS